MIFHLLLLFLADSDLQSEETAIERNSYLLKMALSDTGRSNDNWETTCACVPTRKSRRSFLHHPISSRKRINALQTARKVELGLQIYDLSSVNELAPYLLLQILADLAIQSVFHQNNSMISKQRKINPMQCKQN